MPKFLREKRAELIWALSLQDYSQSHIAAMFNIDRATVLRIIAKKPKSWKVKWVKVEK